MIWKGNLAFEYFFFCAVNWRVRRAIMDRKTVNLCALIGFIAVLVYACEAVPKYESNSSKRWVERRRNVIEIWDMHFSSISLQIFHQFVQTFRRKIVQRQWHLRSSFIRSHRTTWIHLWLRMWTEFSFLVTFETYDNSYSFIQGYPHSASGVGGYAPMKIDLGGVVLGAIIGIGALLIVPKVVGAFNGGYGGSYGGNYRS